MRKAKPKKASGPSSFTFLLSVLIILLGVALYLVVSKQHSKISLDAVPPVSAGAQTLYPSAAKLSHLQKSGAGASKSQPAAAGAKQVSTPTAPVNPTAL